MDTIAIVYESIIHIPHETLYCTLYILLLLLFIMDMDGCGLRSDRRYLK